MTAESVLKTAQVAEIIGISTSTMRKYALELEKHDAFILKDEKGERIYTQSDLYSFKHLRSLMDERGYSFASAVEKVAQLMKDNKEAKKQAGHNLAVTDQEILREALTEIKALRAEVAELKEEQIGERAKERQAFMVALNEIKTLQIEVYKERDEVLKEKRGFFSRLFGGNKE